METLEFIIGSSCAEVTAAIEAKLGIVAHRELTSENFAQQQVTSQSATQLDRVSDTDTSGFSQW
jgi:hypothetical protein